jgi:two-component system chemotaxis response regulator CheY
MARVLVVDDNPAMRLVARAMLEADGHEVAEAGDGGEAVRAFREQAFDLVLCDLDMPDQDGVGTIRALRALDPGARVVAMSRGHRSCPGLDLVRLARGLGAQEGLRKPFGRLALVAAVARALGAPAVP